MDQVACLLCHRLSMHALVPGPLSPHLWNGTTQYIHLGLQIHLARRGLESLAHTWLSNLGPHPTRVLSPDPEEQWSSTFLML